MVELVLDDDCEKTSVEEGVLVADDELAVDACEERLPLDDAVSPVVEAVVVPSLA
jgi:hypothetical protein